MGLDQYLQARKYVSGYDFRPLDEQNSYEDLLEVAGLSRSEFHQEANPTGSIELNVAYWRKANQIHRWFIDNHAPNQVDDCRPFYVDREALMTLRDLCKEVLADPSKAQELLPVGYGSFFGGDEYDKFYIQDLHNTVSQLDRILDNPKFADFEFQYRASW